MKHNRNLLKNKKGVSTLFIAIYAALLTIILVSSLFVATGIYQSSLVDALRLEQKRQQEKILISGPNGITFSDEDDVVLENVVARLRIDSDRRLIEEE